MEFLRVRIAFEFVRVDDSDKEDDGDLKLMKAAIKHAMLEEAN